MSDGIMTTQGNTRVNPSNFGASCVANIQGGFLFAYPTPLLCVRHVPNTKTWYNLNKNLIIFGCFNVE